MPVPGAAFRGIVPGHRFIKGTPDLVQGFLTFAVQRGTSGTEKNLVNEGDGDPFLQAVYGDFLICDLLFQLRDQRRV